MTAGNVILADGIHLVQNGVYRGRMLIHAMKVLAGEGTVSDKLSKQGFADITFFDKDDLPSDWPEDQKEDPSDAFRWTAYLQGRFTLTDRVIPLSELGTRVTLYGMWLQQSAAAAEPATVEPLPAKPDGTESKPTAPVEEQSGSAGLLAASVGGVAMGFILARSMQKR